MKKQSAADIILGKQIDQIFKPKKFKPDPIPDVHVNVGDTLNHQRFGKGVVIEVDNDICIVKFEDGSTKHLVSKFAGFNK